jgi:hypothetical protein
MEKEQDKTDGLRESQPVADPQAPPSTSKVDVCSCGEDNPLSPRYDRGRRSCQ